MKNITVPKKSVAVCGSFDIIHRGHLRFLGNASEKYGELHIIVVPDDVYRENKKREPVYDQAKRVRNLQPFCNYVRIDSFRDGMRSLVQIKPDYFCLGYDQFVISEEIIQCFFDFHDLETQIVRLERYADGIHSSKILESRKASIDSQSELMHNPKAELLLP